jgi:hypothetical protein
MVKLARILTSTSDGLPLLTAQVKSTEFQSAEIQAYLLSTSNNNDNIAPSSSSSTFCYINLSSIATTASAFLSLGDAALVKAKILIERATSSSDAKVTDPFIAKNVIFREKVLRILSPLDGQKEVGKFIVS